MTPIECMKLQLDRGFSCTIGCGELESIARHVLLDLCGMNQWTGIWLLRTDYCPKCEGESLWSHGHWQGNASYPCSFDEYVTYHETIPGRFQVNQKFIDAMHFAEET